MGKITGLVRLSRYYLSFLNSDFISIYTGRAVHADNGNRTHIEAAIKWICRAQDSDSADRGVARSYSLTFHPYFEKTGWVSSYPETTGYIIPTLFDYAKISGDSSLIDRALEMADWECDVQLENGAVQGGTIAQKPTPAVFNTGQVIFGWVRAFKETHDEKYLSAAEKAGNFLISVQSEDGAWRRSLSDYAGDSQMDFYVYNTRSAWALLALSTVSKKAELYRSAGAKNIDFALQQQIDSGWFESNCLNRPDQPLVHTIAYCIRGILESGIILKNDTYVNQAQKAADALILAQREDGSLAGRYDRDWQPTVDWSCLTGNAQTSIIWSKLHVLSSEKRYLDSVQRINGYLRNVQLVNISNPDIHGGICGSHPVQGQYGKFEILNWAVKFFIDALLMEEFITGKLTADDYSGAES